jgi:microcystin-dependent protein
MNVISLRTLFIVCALLLNSSLAFGQSPTSFTYQGRLNLNGNPANGSYDMDFILLDGAYNPLIFSAVDPVGVTNGLFTVMLDYGAAFDGSQRYLRIGVRPHGDTNSYTFLSPPQTLTAAPYAIYAENVGPSSSVPPGSIMAYMGTNPPSGWLLCDGSAVSRTLYSRLFAVIGVANGYGDGMNTFNLPDLRAMFLRGVDGDAGIDIERDMRAAAKPGGNAGNAVGSLQQDEFKSHNHANGLFNQVLRLSSGTSTTATSTAVNPSEPNIIESVPMLNAGATETRPKNVYVNYIIKL